jgi:predicted HTH transcriptional regulator
MELSMVNYVSLLNELLKYGGETSWIEFKENNSDFEEIAKRVCGLANAAALNQRQYGYMVWGVRDSDLGIVGTHFNPQREKKGNEYLINWLRILLSDNVDFNFHDFEMDGKRIVIMTIRRATVYPVKFRDVPYIRDQTVTKPLNKLPQLESLLWNELNRTNYDLLPAKTDLSAEEVKRLLDYEGSMRLTGNPISDNDEYLMHVLCDQRIIARQDDGYYYITNMGALLFCRSFKDFPSLERRALRIIRYSGTTPSNISREVTEDRGYALSFEENVRTVDLILPSEEIFVNGVRQLVRHFSDIALRELLANAMIHQDLTKMGMNLAIEVFDNRVEISNPGVMMVDEKRILDSEPISRNEAIGSMMRKIGFCEELGSGWDRIVESCEYYNLPIPVIRSSDHGTRVIMQDKRSLLDMSVQDRIWNCYMHTCLMFSSGSYATNSSLKQRFKLESTNSNSVLISRLIKQTQEKGLIKLMNNDSSKRNMAYVPYWA